MRLDKYLAETAQCTRSEAKTMLAKGRVQVNGAVCKKGDTQLKDNDTVTVDGAPLRYQKFVYLMLNMRWYFARVPVMRLGTILPLSEM